MTPATASTVAQPHRPYRAEGFPPRGRPGGAGTILR